MRARQNDKVAAERELILACLAQLRAGLGTGAVEYEPARPGKGAGPGGDGGRLALRGPWGSKKFDIQARRGVAAAMVPAIVARLSQQNPPILMTEYVSPPVAAFLREHRVNYADAAGNMFLKSPPLWVWLEGRKRQLPAHRPDRPFQVAGLKILSVLLNEPQAADATYRDLAERAGVSLGAIVPVFEDLAREGFLRVTRSGRQMLRCRELLDQWTLGYARRLFPRIFLQTCRLAGDRTVEDLIQSVHGQRRGEVLLGGEAAAGLATGYLRANRAMIHLPRSMAMSWMAEARLIPDPAGNVDMVVLYGEENQWRKPPKAIGDIPTANPVLIYGELLRQARDARVRETAERVLDQFLLPRFGGSAWSSI